MSPSPLPLRDPYQSPVTQTFRVFPSRTFPRVSSFVLSAYLTFLLV